MRSHRARGTFLLVAAGLALAAPAARAEGGVPEPLARVGYDQRLGETVPADLAFADESGGAVRLGDYLGRRPAVLALVYYECPMLCSLVLQGLVASLKPVDFDPGRDFEVVVVSFDPEERPPLAAAAKATALARYARPETAAGWHFLTGAEGEIRRLAEAVGFRYAWDAASGQWAHAAGIVLLTPQGELARYLFGVEFPARDLRLGLVETAAGTIGTVVDHILLYCYRYDPATGSYGAAAMNLVRLGGAATVMALGAFLTVAWRRERRRTRPGAPWGGSEGGLPPARSRAGGEHGRDTLAPAGAPRRARADRPVSGKTAP